MNNFKNWLYTEMPITRFQLMGQWEPNSKKYGYDKKDIGILTSPRGVEKIHKLWSNTKFNFDFYFLRSSLGYKYIELGEVTIDWVKKNLGVDIIPNPNNITVIFTNNRGTEKIPMTAWAIAHRLGHAIRRLDSYEYFSREILYDFRTILDSVYNLKIKNILFASGEEEIKLRSLAYALGTMKSIRDKNLVNFYEFIHELVAQYIITSKIKFNPLPNKLTFGKRTIAYNDDSQEVFRWNDYVEQSAEKYESILDSLFNGLKNKIFVM